MKQPGSLPAGVHERDASDWQGTRHRYPEVEVDHAGIDLPLQAWLGRLTGQVSPAALAMAWFDWSTHLAFSPNKQLQLAMHAASAGMRWLRYSASAVFGDAAGPVEPLAQDMRFADPEWHRRPWNVLSQGFLLQQQWWHRATRSVRGMSRHHADVATFVARQLLDGVAPSNFVLTNPVVQQASFERGGMNLVAGTWRAFGDSLRAAGGDTPQPGFRPGHEVAVTPGKVVLRNRLIELLRYDPATPQVHAVPLLVVPAWIMKYYILYLSPQNSLVRYLVEHGHTVYIISWKNPGPEDSDLGLDDYRRLGIMASLDAIVADSGSAQVNACGYCLGGTLLAIAASAMAREHDRRLASLTLLAGQVDFTEPGELSLFVDESEVSFLEAAMWSQGYLETRQMAGAFQLLRSNDLASARYLVDGKPVALTDIGAPVFAVGTRTDHVAPWRSVYKIGLLTDTEVTFLLTSGGHNAGVVAPPGGTGRCYQVTTQAPEAPYVDPDRWQREAPVHEGCWWPAWEAWLAQQAGEWVQARTPGPGLEPAPGRYVLAP